MVIAALKFIHNATSPSVPFPHFDWLVAPDKGIYIERRNTDPPLGTVGP